FPTVPFVFWNNSKTLPDEVGIIITTYDIATRHALAVKEREWDLVIFDEADVLSKPENKMVQTLKDAVGDAYKLLLTPTPITMSIMDIYWLIHFIDESVMPDADWFYKRYFRQPERYKELTEWVSQFCFRTLKVQTTDYVNFTRRIPITVDYELSKEEKLIYKLVSAYILSDDKAAYPEMDSYNLNLLFFKSLSSSPRAFSNILDGAIKRTYGHEKAILEEIQKLTDDIHINSKTAELLKILKTTFNHLKSMKVKQKAIIYVEHSLTFDYLYKIFLGQGYNTIKYKDNDSIEQFRFDDEIQILIANDEASKGIDLEFCPVVVNYDLPYDSVKIEQRICRCHRQGQNSDVLVINMLSKENFADVRILELINKRTLQFNGIFGMSDDIVGNFDTKIKEVLQNFRSSTEVQDAFKNNLAVNKEANEELVDRTEDILFTTFTKSIADKVSINPKYMEDKIDEINKDLWEVVKYYFLNIKEGWYEIDDENKTLKLIEGYNRPYLFSYKDDRFLKDYKGYQQYGMNKD
ncbi:DEAD/DEAH box helicase, partial [bacterium]|nr:DEAD/DEAH box helicase [bacterium]